jgi:hypothetical protein
VLKLRQIVDHGSPNGIDINLVVLMPEPVADATNVAPGKARAENFSLITEPDRRFADHLQLALDGRYRFQVGPECLGVHALDKLLDRSDRIGNVAERK